MQTASERMVLMAMRDFDTSRRCIEDDGPAEGAPRTSAVEPVATFRERIEATAAQLRAFSQVAPHHSAENPERQACSTGKLGGAAIALKASLPCVGMSATYGSRAVDGDESAECQVAASLRAAGASLIGLTNMDEFGIGVQSSNSRHGATRNPWDISRSPGGSSGGSAVAVAAGLCFAAIGVDTAGSLRIPAALCGVTGIIPCQGLVPIDTHLLGVTSFDRIGPIARTAADCALVLDVIRGDPEGPSFLGGITRLESGVRIGVATAYVKGCAAGVTANFERALGVIAQLEVALGDSALDRIDVHPMLTMLARERYQSLGPLLEKRAADLEPKTRAYLLDAEQVTDAQLAEASERCEEARLALLRGMAPFDVIVLPTTPGTAPKCEATHAHRALLLNTFAFNLSKQPAITVPTGFSEGLPTALTFVGLPGYTALLLKLAHAYQSMTTHHLAVPQLNHREET